MSLPRRAWIAGFVALGAAASAIPSARTLDASRARGVPYSAGLSPDSISGVLGQTHDVALNVDLTAEGLLLGSYSVSISWDSAIVRLDSVRAGTFLPPVVNYVNGGEVRLAQAVGASGGVGGVITLAHLHFRFVNDTIGRRAPINVVFTDLVATDFIDLRGGLDLVTGVSRVLPPTVVMRFSPDSTHERVGGRPVIELTADLDAAPGVALGSYAAMFTWDTTVMRLDSVGFGGFALPEWTQPNAGELRLAAADGQGLAGVVSLARLYFRFVDEVFPRLTSMALSVSEMHAARTFANLLPGVVARDGKAVIGGVLRGDIDINGDVGALDAQRILMAAVGLPLPDGLPGLPHGDADCGGSLEARDAQIVLNAAVGNPVSQFCVSTIR